MNRFKIGVRSISQKKVSFFFLFFWLACLTSQSFMDLGDFCLIVLGLTFLFRHSKAQKDWTKIWPKTTGLEYLWLTWLAIVGIGLLLNHAEPKSGIKSFLEFRWMFSFQLLCFTLAWLNWDQKLLKWFLAILAYISFISYILYYHQLEDFRAGGVFMQSMPFSHSFGPIFVLCSAFAIEAQIQKLSWRWYATATAVLTGLITTLSMTRGVWLGMTVGLLVISFVRSRRYGAFLIAALLVFFSSALIFSPEARQRTLSTNSSNNRSDNERKAIWSANFEIVKDYPILGIGYGENETHLREYYDKLGISKSQFVSHAHNQFLHFWAGTGTLGLICYLIFFFQLLRLTWLGYKNTNPQEAIRRALSLGSFGAQITFLIGGLTESNFSIAKNRYLYLLISALGVSIYYRFVKKSDFNRYQEKTKLSPTT